MPARRRPMPAGRMLGGPFPRIMWQAFPYRHRTQALKRTVLGETQKMVYLQLANSQDSYRDYKATVELYDTEEQALQHMIDGCVGDVEAAERELREELLRLAELRKNLRNARRRKG